MQQYAKKILDYFQNKEGVPVLTHPLCGNIACCVILPERLRQQRGRPG